MNQKSLTLDSPLLFIYFNFFYIAQIVVLGLGTRCPPRVPSLPVSCSPTPHHVFPEGPLDGHGRNAVSDENALPYICSFLYLVDYIVPYSYCKLTIIFSIPNSTCQTFLLFLVYIDNLYILKK